jgi:dienelactone hydrolase
MQTKTIEYQCEGLVMEGFLAIGDTALEKQPLVLVVHDWTGQREFAQEKAKYFAKQGFIGFAVDLYGKGKRGSDTDITINQKLLNELLEDRSVIVTRMQAALNTALALPTVDQDRIMAIGFCMGGMSVLDFARSGASIGGVVSIHGILGEPKSTSSQKIKSKVLVLQGHDDPMATPEQILAFETEMTKKAVDWQVHVFGNTVHAFTNPKADGESLSPGLRFSSLANARSWELVRNFSSEIFA